MPITLVKPTLAQLRELIGAVQTQARERHHFSIYPEGLPQGSLIEIAGSGKTEFVALFLKEQPELKTAWVEDSISINPYALRQKGVRLKNILFIEAGREISWCLNQALQSGCFQVVVAESRSFREKDLRRYQLLSEKSNGHFFLLSETLGKSWAPHLQFQVEKLGSQLKIKNSRQRGLG